MLTDAQRGRLHGLLILAATDGGHIPADPKRVKVALRFSGKVDLDAYTEWLEPCNGECKHYPEEFDNKGQRRRAHAVPTPCPRRRDQILTRGREGEGEGKGKGTPYSPPQAGDEEPAPRKRRTRSQRKTERARTHDEFGHLRWCDHQAIGAEPDPECVICQAKEQEALDG